MSAREIAPLRTPASAKREQRGTGPDYPPPGTGPPIAASRARMHAGALSPARVHSQAGIADSARLVHLSTASHRERDSELRVAPTGAVGALRPQHVVPPTVQCAATACRMAPTSKTVRRADARPMARRHARLRNEPGWLICVPARGPNPWEAKHLLMILPEHMQLNRLNGRSECTSKPAQFQSWSKTPGRDPNLLETTLAPLLARTWPRPPQFGPKRAQIGPTPFAEATPCQARTNQSLVEQIPAAIRIGAMIKSERLQDTHGMGRSLNMGPK